MTLYGLFILGVNIKYIVFSILYRHINVPMACRELIINEPNACNGFLQLPNTQRDHKLVTCSQ